MKIPAFLSVFFQRSSLRNLTLVYSSNSQAALSNTNIWIFRSCVEMFGHRYEMFVSYKHLAGAIMPLQNTKPLILPRVRNWRLTVCKNEQKLRNFQDSNIYLPRVGKMMWTNSSWILTYRIHSQNVHNLSESKFQDDLIPTCLPKVGKLLRTISIIGLFFL